MAEQLVTLWRYRDLTEALIAQGKLDSQKIWCVLADDNFVRLSWFWSNPVGGVRLQVAEDDVSLALELLAEGIPESFASEEIGEEYRQPHCPKCESRNVNFEPLYRGIALAVLWATSLPVWIPKSLWHCEDCGHEWKAEYE